MNAHEILFIQHDSFIFLYVQYGRFIVDYQNNLLNLLYFYTFTLLLELYDPIERHSLIQFVQNEAYGKFLLECIMGFLIEKVNSESDTRRVKIS